MRPWTLALTVLLIVSGVAVALAAWYGSTSPGPSAAPQTPAPSPSPEPEYEYPDLGDVGICFNPISDRDDGSFLAMQVIDCGEPHLSELIGIGELEEPEGTAWPGEASVDRDAEVLCRAVFREYVGISLDQSSLDMVFYYPTVVSWAGGDREVWCAADTTSAAPFTSTVRNLKE